MTGSGNDFVLLDGRATTPAEWPATRVVQLCDRRTGVGADGLVILTPDQPGAVRMAFWNSDGSRAAMCGNAALCSTRLSVYLELTAPGDLRLLTDAGMVRARCPDAGDQAEIRLPDFDLAQVDGTGCPGSSRARRALDGVRHGGGAAPGRPGGRHRGGGSASAAAGASASIRGSAPPGPT